MSSMHAFAHGSSSDDSDSDNEDFLHPSTDPNADEFADYNPRKRRRTGRDAKESAALGVFGSESEDDGPGKRWKKKSLRGKGMSFVGTGQERNTDGEEDATAEDEDADEDIDMEDQDEPEAPRAGLGMGVRGLGFGSPAPSKNKPRSSFGTPLGKGFIPSSAAVPVLRDFDHEKPSTPRIPQRSAFETPQKGTPKGLSFAERQMAKMGYKQGQGLGKEGQGRAAPIEVKLRPQGVGIGAVREKSQQEKEEEKRQAKLKGEKYEDSDEERKKVRRKPKGSGTSSGMSTPRRAPKPKFQTLEEVQKSAPGLHIPDSYASILDMTGPERKLLTSAVGLSAPSTPAAETIEQKEHKEHMKLALRAQREIDSFGQQWINLQERKQWIAEQLRQEQKIHDLEQTKLDQFRSFADNVQGLSQASADGQWDPIVSLLKDVEKLGLSDVNDDLSTIAVAAVHPFLRLSTEGWQPLEDPKLNGITTTLSSIQHIIGATLSKASTHELVVTGSHRSRVKATSPYETMIYKLIFPKMISSIPGWNVHKPSPMLALLEAWKGLLPGFVRSQLLQAIVGKLDDAVSSWNPRKKRSHELPHLWLFPWLQYLPAHHADPKSTVGLVSDIKRKFRQLIDSWDFHRGVVPGLEQWRDVLYASPSNDQWTPLIMNHVLPSMAKFLKDPRNFQVDPNDQAPFMPALQGIFAWKDVLKARVIGQFLVEAIFPMWHNVLHQWLTVVGPNQEIGQWFEWWRDEVFPVEVKHLKAIEEEFEKGHKMINTALDLGSKASTHLPAPVSKSRIDVVKSPPSSAPVTPLRPPIIEESTFRHKVEDWCIENDLQFLPEKKVLHAAGPLFRITAAGHGKNGTLVYFKGDSLFALSRKGPEQSEIKIDWEQADARDALLGMAWHNVK
ncbi:tuftelin interacting protein 11 [Phlyctema vagabunda]|uniref:Tuftelin interacting protein 11 n=1 Tax=Phlyctema vagabunda TaxID=108571 RepID=A0ABR4PXM5_9HELO